MVEISIVSGTYNRLPHLQKMVESCRQSVSPYEYEIIIVDGGSTDGTIDWCKLQHDIRLIEQGELLGAISAFNAGCAIATGRFVAILNDDIEIVSNTLSRARDYLNANPWCGQVAFRNNVVGVGDLKRQQLSRAYGLLYGQCSMTPKHLGDYAGWWGDEGMRTYGGDTRLSLRLWEMGYPTIHVPGCEIIDHVVEDDLRKANSGDPWRVAREKGEIHPDLIKFTKFWKGRLPQSDQIIPAANQASVVMSKARCGNLRTLRFKGMMARGHKMRTTLIDILGTLGTAKQINQAELKHQANYDPANLHRAVLNECKQFLPDLVILQSQRDGNISPETAYAIRNMFPFAFIINFDGDTHYPLTDFNLRMAESVHLQCVVSPSVFKWYADRGVGVAYWPIGIESDYIVPRGDFSAGPDISFLGALYGQGVFPQADTRENAVRKLVELRSYGEIDFLLLGNGWRKIGIETDQTNERHSDSAAIYSRSKMALSISQSASLWGYTSDRLYNICATGCPALVQQFSGMNPHGFVDGETCISWSDIDEMVAKMRYYLKNESEREKIGAAGRELVLSRHTWNHRVDALLTMIEYMAR